MRPSASPRQRCTPEELVRFFIAAAKGEPRVGVADAYKWIFQATMGGEHAIRDEDHAWQWLVQEWSTLDHPLPDEPLVLPLRPDGAIVRLNLRPFRAGGGEQVELHRAFVESAKSFQNSKQDLEATWIELGRILQVETILGLTLVDYEEYDAEVRQLEFPARHHSQCYEQVAKPAYRVLIGAIGQEIVQKLQRVTDEMVND